MFKTILMKDLSALFKQKSVILTLLMPALIIIAIGIIPLFMVSSAESFQVHYLVEDEGIEGLNLSSTIMDELNILFDNDNTIELVELTDIDAFYAAENAFWLPANFTEVANATRVATYYMIISDSNIQANPIMTGRVQGTIDAVITRELLPVQPPEINALQLYPDDQLTDDGVAKNRGNVGFGLAYIAFLILIMGGSILKITGFSAERESGMMELLLTSVDKRHYLILSKLITGISYGFASIMSYIVGLGVVILVSSIVSNESTNFIMALIPEDIITPLSIFAVILMFVSLSFMSMNILLFFQLSMGREAGDRFGGTATTMLSILFYMTSLVDPIEESPIQVINPYYWPFKLALNMIFKEDLLRSLLYGFLIISFSLILLKKQTSAIEKEKVLFE